MAHSARIMQPTFRPLIQGAGLAALLQSPQRRPLIVDCSFDLADAEAGPWAYASAHLPGAVYLHLEHDLSGVRTGRNGRHPLPERSRIRAPHGQPRRR